MWFDGGGLIGVNILTPVLIFHRLILVGLMQRSSLHES